MITASTFSIIAPFSYFASENVANIDYGMKRVYYSWLNVLGFIALTL